MLKYQGVTSSTIRMTGCLFNFSTINLFDKCFMAFNILILSVGVFILGMQYSKALLISFNCKY